MVLCFSGILALHKGCMFCHVVFIRFYFSLTLDVYNILFIGSLGFMVVDTTKNNTYWSTPTQIYSPWPSFLPSPAGFEQYEGQGEYIRLHSRLQVSIVLIITANTSSVRGMEDRVHTVVGSVNRVTANEHTTTPF